ncbi:MAG: restriction endonuclease subunit S [Spirochaetales bacterium]|nr:restriction endonuclease subunit S [Spirochaetales bacterium]
MISLGNGKDYKHLEKGVIPVYGTGGYMTSVDQYLCDKDSIGIGRKGTIDQPYILRAPFWTVDTLFFATPKDNIELDYLFGIFQTIDWKQKDESTGVPSLSKQNINTIEVFVSFDKSEQKSIGKHFSQLDNLITLHQRE